MHVQKQEDGRVSISEEFWRTLVDLMVHAEYAVNGPIKLPRNRDDRIDMLMELHQMTTDSGLELEQLC